MIKSKISLFVFIVFFVLQLKSQTTVYQQDLTGMKDQWHTIHPGNEVLSVVKPDFADFRIYAVSPQKDTLEVPYFLNIKQREVQSKNQSFDLLNKTEKDGDFYYTFKMKAPEVINEIQLSFSNKNFDWRVALQGSHNQQDWFTLLEDYRILSIKNEITNYRFTRLGFPKSNFPFYLLKINAAEKPENFKAILNSTDTIPGTYNPVMARSEIQHDKVSKKTTVLITLQERSPVSELAVQVNDTFDYQRPLEIQYLFDSIQTDNGWKYYYKTIQRDYLSSLEKNNYSFNNTFTKDLKLIISNHDNTPLQIGTINLAGPAYQIIARFDNPGYRHFIQYGLPDKHLPQYDIVNFKNKIPENLSPLETGLQTSFEIADKKTPALIENKLWLWIAMIVLIAILGFFTISMMKKVK